MIKRLISGALICVMTVFAQSAKAQPVHSEKQRHIIYLIHGLGGDETTFPNMAKALKENLKKHGPKDIDWAVRTFLYATGSDKNVYDFAKDLNADIEDTYNRVGGLRTTDKLSFVMHSQGGLVGLSWVFNSFVRNPKFHAKYASHMDAFISLGSPFWGSKQALWAEKLKVGEESVSSNGAEEWTLNPWTQYKRANKRNVMYGVHQLAKIDKVQEALASFGVAEMRDMALGSNKLFDFRNGALAVLGQKELLEIVKKQVRVFNIGSYLPNLIRMPGIPYGVNKDILAATTGLNEVENDGAVVLPSARLDFIYANLNRPGYTVDDRASLMDFSESEFGKFTVVPALHVNPKFPEQLFDMDSLAQIPTSCISDIDCKHPTFKMIVQHLLGEEVNLDNPHIAKMTAFLVDMNIILPLNSPVKAKDIRIEILDTSSGVKAIDPDEFSAFEARDVSQFDYHPAIYPNPSAMPHWSQYRRAHFTGTVENSYNANMTSKAGAKRQFHASSVSFRLSAPGMKPRTITALVRPTKVTYINLNLENL